MLGEEAGQRSSIVLRSELGIWKILTLLVILSLIALQLFQLRNTCTPVSVGKLRTCRDWGPLDHASDAPHSAVDTTAFNVDQLQKPQLQRFSNESEQTTVPEHPVCRFLRSGHPAPRAEHQWGPYGICMEQQAHEWVVKSRSNCYSCLNPQRNICLNSPKLYYHQFLDAVQPQHLEANLLSIRTFLLTQDLNVAHMIIWTPDPNSRYNNSTKQFFDTFSAHLSLKHWNYNKEVQGTPWADDPFFGNERLIKQWSPVPAIYSDIVRIILLHKYGGLWMDNDVILYNDVTHLLAMSYQFVMRPMNNHIMYMTANSTLTWRMMDLAKTMPLNHPNYTSDIIEKRCNPVGYVPVVPDVYKYADIYNSCLLRMLLYVNNTGLPPEATLYDMPLGWWDQYWPNCLGSNWAAIDDVQWQEVASINLALHSRYPKVTDLGAENSPLRRVLDSTHAFFQHCRGSACLPVKGMPLVSYAL